MDLKPIRQRRLADFARMKGVQDNPSGLGLLIGKRPNQVYNLLHGTASFGEKVARSIEQSAQLPTMWLDVDPEAGERLPGWPFAPSLLDRLITLGEHDRIYVEGRLEEAIAGKEKVAREKSDKETQQQTRSPIPATKNVPTGQTFSGAIDLQKGSKSAAGNKAVGIQKSRRGGDPKRTT